MPGRQAWETGGEAWVCACACEAGAHGASAWVTSRPHSLQTELVS